MFERFDNEARRTVVLAQEEARILNHNYIGTEHLLLGMLHVGEHPIVAEVLRPSGLTLEVVRTRVEEIIGLGGAAPSGHIPFTPRAKKVLELSLREALQLGHNYIATYHIFLGLIREGEGVAAQILSENGIDLSSVRHQIVFALTPEPAKAKMSPVEEFKDLMVRISQDPRLLAEAAFMLDPQLAMRVVKQSTGSDRG